MITPESSLVALQSVSKQFANAGGFVTHALVDVSLELANGEFLAVVGRSGGGKTTLLRLIAGLEKPSSGGRVATFGRRDLGFVFQEGGWFPWLSVEQNLTFSLRVRRVPEAIRRERANAVCRLVGLDPTAVLSKYPRELSGGERRRVAIGSMLAHEPALLLLDEPSAHLDSVTQLRLDEMIQELWLKALRSIVLVTHSIDEAIFLADRVVVLHRGRLTASLSIPLERPRLRSVIRSSEFSDCRDRLLEILA